MKGSAVGEVAMPESRRPGCDGEKSSGSACSGQPRGSTMEVEDGIRRRVEGSVTGAGSRTGGQRPARRVGSQ